MTLETKYGVPTVSLHTDKFDRVVRAVVEVAGMPGLRKAFVPQPVMGKTAAELRAYVDGADPLTGRPVMQEVVEGFTRPVTDAERGPEGFDRSSPRLLAPDTAEALERRFLESHWTDGLPIVLPTEARVAAMLAGTRRKPDELVGRMRSTHTREAWSYSVEKVAVNAVMAGARPEHLPVILALAATGVTARSSSSSAMAAMAVVNGPIRLEVGMNAGTGAMGPYSQANAAIGRAYSLLSQNLQGGSVPGVSYMGNQGNAYAYAGVTFAENEERSPWGPFHCDHGFARGDSAVSVFTGCRSTAFTLGLRERHWREHVAHLLKGMDPTGPPTLLLDPIAARQFVGRGGFTDKKAMLDWIHDVARLPAREYWDYQLVQNYIYPRATAGEEPWASRLRAAPDEPIPMFRREDVHAVVVGGETNGYWRIMGCTYQKSASVDDWR